MGVVDDMSRYAALPSRNCPLMEKGEFSASSTSRSNESGISVVGWYRLSVCIFSWANEEGAFGSVEEKDLVLTVVVNALIGTRALMETDDDDELETRLLQSDCLDSAVAAATVPEHKREDEASILV